MKYFAISDIHSFYSLAKEALDRAGFDPNNENHTLVVCGDVFDRGDETKEMYEYIKSLPRKILVRGNHESLLEEMAERGYPLDHDIHNGTAKTVCDLNDFDFYDYYLGLADGDMEFPAKTKKTVELTKWIDENFVDYAEFTKYIAVHSWIPTRIRVSRTEKFDYKEVPDAKWRTASEKEWERARWVNPYDYASRIGGVPRGKKIIAGHWHASCAWHEKFGTPEFGTEAIFDTWEGRNLIMIDACTAESGRCNVFVFEDDQPVKLGLTKNQRKNI